MQNASFNLDGFDESQGLNILTKLEQDKIQFQPDADHKTFTVSSNTLIHLLRWNRKRAQGKQNSRSHISNVTERITALMPHMEKCSLPQYTALITAVSQMGFINSRTLAHTLSLLDHMERHGMQPNVFTYTALIKVCTTARDGNKAFEIYEQLKASQREQHRAECKPNLYTFTTLIHACAANKDVNKAFEILEEIKKQGLEPNHYTYTALITVCTATGDLDRATTLLEEMHKAGVMPDVATYTALIGACSNHNEAYNFLQKMKQNDIKPDVIAYSGIMQGFVSAGKLAKAHQVIEEMKQSGIQPNTATYNVMIGGYATAKQVDKAFDIYERIMLNESKLQPDIITFIQLLHVCALAKDFNSAKRVLDELDRWKVKPNLSMFKYVLDSCNMPEQAFSALEMLEARYPETKPDVSMYNGLIHACGEAKRLDKAFSVLNVMKQKGVEPHASSFTVLIKACLEVKDMDKAVATMRLMTQYGIPLNQLTYNALLSCCVATKDADVASELYEQMKRDGIALDAFLFNCILATYVAAFVPKEKVDQILSDMKDAGIQPDTYTYSSLVKMCNQDKNLNKAFGYLTEMEQRNIPIDKHVYASIISTCLRVDEHDRALELYARMKQLRLQLDVVLCNTLIHSCSLAVRNKGRGYLDKALGVFDDMKLFRLPPNGYTYGSLLAGCASANDSAKAIELLQSMKEQNVPMDPYTEARVMQLVAMTKNK